MASTLAIDLYINGNLGCKTFAPPAASIGPAAIAPNSLGAGQITTTLGQGSIPLDITSARIIAANDTEAGAATPSGGILANDSGPALKRENGATDIALRVVWAAGSVVEIQLPPVAYPPDLDPTQPIVFNVRGQMNGAADTPVLTVKYFEGVGGSNKGGNTPASFSNAEQTLTLAINSVAAPPQHANLSLTPGPHGTNALEIHAAWLTYTRK